MSLFEAVEAIKALGIDNNELESKILESAIDCSYVLITNEPDLLCVFYFYLDF